MAKGFITEFLVKVGSVGLSKTKKDVDQLATSTQKVGDAHAAAGKSAREHFNTQDKGIIGTANSTRSFSKLSQTINGGGSSSVVGAYATLAANVFALTALFNALRAAASMQQIEKGLEALGTRTGQTLSISANGLREITGFAISTEQALRSTAQVMSAGFNGEQLERLGKVANDTSFALGRNMTDSMDRLTRGVIKLEPELLDELGIMTRLGEATKSYALELNKSEASLTTTERRQAFFNAVMAEGELKFGGLAAQAGNTKAFDQLSASLSDVTKSSLNFINTAALPLAAIFSTSPTALIGAALLFASTIRSQLLPGLSELQNKSIQASKTLADQAKKQKDSLTALRGKAEVTEESAFFSALDLKSIKDGPKGYNKFIAEIGEGTVEIEDQKAALKSLSTSITYNEKELAKMPAGTKAYDIRTAKIRELKAAQDQLTRAIYDQTAAQRILTQTKAQATIVERNLAVTTAQASAQRNAGTAIELASIGKVPEGYKVMSTAIKEYHSSQVIATKGAGVTGKAMGGLKTATFATGTAAKFAGAAFLNFIPILGQVVLVVGLLIAGWHALQSKEAKALNSAIKDLETVVGGLNEKMKELNRINDSTGSAALKAEQSLRLQSNAAIELSESLDKVAKARKAAEERDKTDKSPTTIRGNKTSMFRTLQMDWGEAQALTGTGKALVNAYKGLEAIDPKGLSDLIKNTKGWDTLTQAEMLEKFTKFASTAATGARVVNSELENLLTTQKAAGDSMASFVKATSATTSFDGVVSGMQAYNRAITDSAILSKVGSEEAAKFLDIIRNVPDSIKGMLSVDASKYIEDLKTIASISQKDAKDRSVSEIVALNNSQKRIELGKFTTEMLLEEQRVIQSNFEIAQRAEILAKSENVLLAAKLKANQANNAMSAEGLRKQLEGQNQTLRNNATALRQTKLLLGQQVLHTEAKIEGIKADIESNKLLNERITETLKLNRLSKEASKDLAAERMLNYAEHTPQYAALKKTYDDATTWLKEYDAQAEKIIQDRARQDQLAESSIIALRQERANITNQMLATDNELAAIMSEVLSSGNIEAQVATKRNEIERARQSGLRDSLSIVKSAEEVERRTQLLRTRGRVTAAQELRMAEARTQEARDKLAADYASSKQANADAQNEVKNRGTDSESREAALKVLRDTQEVEDLRYQANLQSINATERYERVLASVFDIQKEGLDWQRQSLDLVEKQISAQNSLLTSVYDRNKAEQDLARKRAGYGEKTKFGERADEIRTATLAFKIAESEASVKKALIDLEYALLEAQSAQLREEMNMRKTLLAADNGDGKNNVAIAQLERVITNLDSINYSGITEAAKAAIDNGVKVAETNLKAAAISSSGMINSAARDYADYRQARKEANEVLSAPKAAAIAGPVIAQAMENTVVDPIVQSQTQLTSGLTELSKTIRSLITVMAPETAAKAGSLSDYTSQEIAAAVGNYAKAQGFRVSEQSAHGGVDPVHAKGSAHYDDRAVDINIGKGNTEWDNPAMKARFDSLQKTFENVGLKIIWNATDHNNHLHAAVDRASLNEVKAFELLGQYLPAKVGTAVAEELATTLPEVLVTARKADVEVLNPTATRSLTEIPQANLPQIVPEWTIKVKEAAEAMMVLNDQSTGLKSLFTELGPQGAAMNAAIEGMSAFGASLETAMNVFQDSGSSTEEKIGAVATAAATALGGLRSTLSASADAKIEAIDREIAAEQKRDGKSAESVAKIAALERKKEAQAKKAFEVNKKLMMAQSIMSTAAAVVGALAAPPIPGSPFNIAMASMMGALGAAQLAIIAGTSYQSTSAPAQQAAMPSTLSVGKRGDTVDLAKNNANAGGEIGYLRGARGQGRSAADYAVVGSAYGGSLPRGYGNTGYLVGEHGPEIIKPEVPVSVQPANDNQQGNPVNATFNIHALDASGVQDILHAQRGFIIGSLREAANANGEQFMENVNTSVYTKPNIGRL